MDFNAMTKAQIGAWAAERGVHLDERWTKARMIEEVSSLLPAPEPACPDTATGVIHDPRRSRLHLAHNGFVFDVPAGRTVTIPRALLPAIADAGATFSED